MRQSLTTKTIIVMFVTGLSKVIGFLRTAILASVFGATWQTDAFYMAQNIIGIIAGISSSGLTSSLVPIRTQLINNQNKEYADRFASSLVNIIVLITTGLAVLSVFLAPQLVYLFAPKFSGDQLSLTIFMVQALTVLIIINALIAVIAGILNSSHHYLPAQLMGFPLSIITIFIAVIWGSTQGIFAMLVGFIIGTIGQLLVLVLPIKKTLNYKLIIEKSSALKDTIVMSIPIFISSSANIINQAVDKALASGLQAGSISAITYANQLTGLATGIIILPITTTLFTSLSELTANGEYERMKSILTRVSTLMIIILSPITVDCLLLAKPIVSIVYQRGSFDEIATGLTTASFFFLVLSLVAIGQHAALSRCFFALKDSQTPLLVTLIGVMINIILNFLLVKPMQIGGLALATSISHFIICGMMLILLRRKVGPLGLFSWMKDSIKVLAGCIFMGPIVWLVFYRISGRVVSKFIIACGTGAIVYLAILWILKQQEIREVTNNFISLIRNRKIT